MSISVSMGCPIGHDAMIALEIAPHLLPEFVERFGIGTKGVVARARRACIKLAAATLYGRAIGAGDADVARQSWIVRLDGLHVEPKHRHQAMHFSAGAVSSGDKTNHVAFGQREVAGQFPSLMLVKGSDLVDCCPTGMPPLEGFREVQGTTSKLNSHFWKVSRAGALRHCSSANSMGVPGY